MQARGTFEVQLRPLATYAQAERGGGDQTPLGRRSIDKQFRGDLEGASQGEMLSAGTPVKGSAGYVAIKRVRGTRAGREGSFVLQHSGTMTSGAGQLTITVVPDSATGALAGLAGTMTIEIAGGQHSYLLDYTLPAGGA